MTNRSLRSLLTAIGACAVALLLAATPATAASITYTVQVDTSVLAGTTGFVDFQFLPGGSDALGATASLTSFNAFDTLFAPTADLSGDASGLLPGSVTLGNSQGFNDLFQGVTFGHQFSFLLTLSGDALSPSAPPLSGTAFSLLLFGSDGMTGTPLSGDNGLLASLLIGPTGQVDKVYYPGANGEPSAATFTEVTAVPEPTTLLLVGSGIVALVARRRQR